MDFTAVNELEISPFAEDSSIQDLFYFGYVNNLWNIKNNCVDSASVSSREKSCTRHAGRLAVQVAGQHCAAWLGWLQAKASSCFRNVQARGSAPSSWPCQQSQSHWLGMVGTRVVSAVVTVPGLVQSVLMQQQQGHILHGHKGKAARSWKLFARKVCWFIYNVISTSNAVLAKNNQRASLAGWWQPPFSSCWRWSLILIPCLLKDCHSFKDIEKTWTATTSFWTSLTFTCTISFFQESSPSFFHALTHTGNWTALLCRTLSLCDLIIYCQLLQDFCCSCCWYYSILLWNLTQLDFGSIESR